SISAAKDLVYVEQYFFTTAFEASYRFYRQEHFLYAYMSAGTRFQPPIAQRPNTRFREPWVNQSFSLTLSYISPLLWIGRIHAKSRLYMQRNNLNQRFSSLGANNGLRGYLASVFQGEHLFRFNFEYRSLPVNLWSIHAGFVLFYDGGSAFGGQDPERNDEVRPFLYKQSVGLGLRLQFPQFDRSVIRLDFGIPLSSGGGDVGSWFSFGFNQAF
ncbi:MAG: BamA/TamA family outer membrane protein, partial [Myxococcota bacterium]